MANVTKELVLNETFMSTEQTPRNVADILADELENIASAIEGGGSGGGVVDVEVNGSSVVDPTTKIAEVTSYEEITESEYETIPVAERESNGIAYFIKDLNNPSVQGYPPLIYSDEEREIGVWRDGKPLYEKTLAIGSLPNATVVSYSHNISDLDQFVEAKGIAVAASKTAITIPWVNTSTPTDAVQMVLSSTSVLITAGTDRSGFTGFITLRYTKTSDVAGSGIWNGQGGIAHHYSMSETVIGTWINGKPLYEKTIDCGALPNSTTKNVEHSISDMEYAVAIQGSAINTNAGVRIPLPYVYGNTRCLQIYIDSTHVKLIAAENMSIYAQSYITLQYTKTTD